MRAQIGAVTWCGCPDSGGRSRHWRWQSRRRPGCGTLTEILRVSPQPRTRQDGAEGGADPWRWASLHCRVSVQQLVDEVRLDEPLASKSPCGRLKSMQCRAVAVVIVLLAIAGC